MRGGTGHFLPQVYMNVSTWDDFTRDNLQNQHNIVWQSGTECLYDKGDGTKNVLAKFFLHAYKRNGTNKRQIHAWRDPV